MIRIVAMKVYAFDFGAPEACVIKVSSSFQFARTVISPTNIIQFQRNKDILIDIDTCINLKSSKRYSMDENRRYEDLRIRFRGPRGVRD